MSEQERLLPAVLVRPQDWATIVDKTGLSIVEGLQTELAILACERVFRSSITTAFCRDEYTSIEVEDLQRSYRAFCLRLDQLQPVIAWELYPDSLRNKFNEHWIHRVAKAKPTRGRPTKWRQREFRLRTLGLYAWAFGQIPSETHGGPTWRFMQATSSLLLGHIESASKEARSDSPMTLRQ